MPPLTTVVQMRFVSLEILRIIVRLSRSYYCKYWILTWTQIRDRRIGVITLINTHIGGTNKSWILLK